MNVWKIFDTIEDAVQSSMRLPGPLSHWSIINRHNFMRLMDKMRTSVSPELKQARAVSKDVQRLLGEAQEQAEGIVAEARESARRQSDAVRQEREALINATEVVQTARKRAEEIELASRQACDELEAQTRVRCQEIRRQAEEYAKEVRRRAELDVRTHETELERYAVKLMSGMERELGKALQTVRAHRENLASRATAGRDADDEDTLTIPPGDVQRVVATAAAMAGSRMPLREPVAVPVKNSP